MKRILAICLLIAMLLVSLSGCKPRLDAVFTTDQLYNGKDIYLALDPDSVTGKGMTYYVVNNYTDSFVYCGQAESAILLAEKNGVWYYMAGNNDQVEDSTFIVPAGTPVLFEWDWTYRYNKLSKGHYMLCKVCQVGSRNTEETLLVNLGLEFNIE